MCACWGTVAAGCYRGEHWKTVHGVIVADTLDLVALICYENFMQTTKFLVCGTVVLSESRFIEVFQAASAMETRARTYSWKRKGTCRYDEVNVRTVTKLHPCIALRCCTFMKGINMRCIQHTYPDRVRIKNRVVGASTN